MPKDDFGTPLLKLLSCEDKGQPLPFLQLGDLFLRDADHPILLVINASCDLQFVPSNVADTRLPKRANSILFLPGEAFSDDTAIPKDELTTGPVQFAGAWWRIKWHRKMLFSLPHCTVEETLKGSGYDHVLRLRTNRALELQQQVFNECSRIGLEVHPPIGTNMDIRLFVNKSEGCTAVGAVIKSGAVKFHTGQREKKGVVILKPEAVDFIREQVIASCVGEDGGLLDKLQSAITSLTTNRKKLFTTPLVEPKTTSGGMISGVKRISLSIQNVKIRLGDTNQDVIECGRKDVVTILFEEP